MWNINTGVQAKETSSCYKLLHNQRPNAVDIPILADKPPLVQTGSCRFGELIMSLMGYAGADLYHIELHSLFDYMESHCGAKGTTV